MVCCHACGLANDNATVTTMTTPRQPSLYIPHGGGPAFFMQGPMQRMFAPMQEYLAGLHQTLPADPTAILLVTAHWESPVVHLTGNAQPQLVYDYFGFPPEMYSLRYDAPGAPALAAKSAALLQAAGIQAQVDPDYGWEASGHCRSQQPLDEEDFFNLAGLQGNQHSGTSKPSGAPFSSSDHEIPGRIR